jgi:hypothetical protein
MEQKQTDHELLIQFMDGDRKAFDALIAKYKKDAIKTENIPPEIAMGDSSSNNGVELFLKKNWVTTSESEWHNIDTSIATGQTISCRALPNSPAADVLVIKLTIGSNAASDAGLHGTFQVSEIRIISR